MKDYYGVQLYPSYSEERECGLWIDYKGYLGGDKLIRISGGQMIWKRFFTAEVTFGAEEVVSVLKKGIIRDGEYTLSDEDGWHKVTFFCEKGMIIKISLYEVKEYYNRDRITVNTPELNLAKLIGDIEGCLRCSALSE